MGHAKAWLTFGGEFLLQRIVRIVSDVCIPVVVVCADGQIIPPLPCSVRIVSDDRVNCGPLAGLECGLTAMESEMVFLTSCDVPLITAESVHRVCHYLTEAVDVAIPEISGQRHPLFAAYRRGLLSTITSMLDVGERKMMRFVAQQRLALIHDLPAEVVRNINTPAEYAEVLKMYQSDSSTSVSPLPAALDS
jgi:molybdenum cofactor guanylyltransferase